MCLSRFCYLSLALAFCLILTGCASKRHIAVDYPSAKAEPLAPLTGYETVDGDDFYVQLVSDFQFKGDSVLKGGCEELAGGYESGKLSAALVFAVHNDTLKLSHEISGFLYEATTGKCNFKMATKKTNLTPWMRLDSGKDTSVDYHFFTSNSSEADFSKFINDVNTASGLLAITGVGTGVAIMGKVAEQWLLQTPPTQAATKPSTSAQYSDETHTLPSAIEVSDKAVTLNHNHLAVYDVIESGLDLFAPEPKALGELSIYPIVTTSLLLKTSKAGLPDARDLSLAELLQAPIKSGNDTISLQQLLTQTKSFEAATLKPNWKNYAEVENSCRQLKQVLKELGFNKFDRNALLFYFLDQAPDWHNYNIPLQRLQSEDLNTRQLKEYRSKNFSACLNKNDFQAMQKVGLTVNAQTDWDNLLNSGTQKESVFEPLHAVERQLLVILKNTNPGEMAQQLYPLLSSTNGPGTVLLQNHLGSFGLEALLQLPALAKEGALVNAEQLSQALTTLAFDKLSCVRPAPERGQILPNTGILLFTTRPGSPRSGGGAIEFEIANDKISRITLQLPSTRDFEQSLVQQPSVAGCQIDPQFFKSVPTETAPVAKP